VYKRGMKPCIYGPDTFPEGTVICVNGRGLKCVLGEWQETGLPCEDEDGAVRSDLDPNVSGPDAGNPPVTKAKR
jgi:hypothetical protein